LKNFYTMKTLNRKIKGLSTALGIILLSTFTSCQTEELNQNEIGFGAPETAVSESLDGDLVTLNWLGQEIEAVKQGDLYMVGDMIIDGVEVDADKGETGLSSAGTSYSTGRTDRLWHNNTVPYIFNSNLPDAVRDNVLEAISRWENDTNIRFVERTNEEDYIDFVWASGVGCSSFVGRVGNGDQRVVLTNSCDVGLISHEIGHVIGFFHEQQRQDRDDFVTVHEENMQINARAQYSIWSRFGGKDLTADLDFGSIMIYGSFLFSSNGEPVMTKKDGSTFERESTHLSEGDIRGAALLYPPPSIGVKANNGLYMSSEDGNKPMTVNRTRDGAWERFELEIIGEEVLYTIKGSNGLYVSSEGGRGPITCNRASAGRWEKFSLEHVSGNGYNIKDSRGMYLSSNNGDEEKGLTFDRSNPGRWEVFEIDGL